MEDPELETKLSMYHRLGVITFREWQALDARFVRKVSVRSIAAGLGISRRSVRDRLGSGLRKIVAHERSAA
jgi:FixJ family two-component response regulator